MRKNNLNNSDDEINYNEDTQRDPLLSTLEGSYIDLENEESIFGQKNPYQEAGFISRWLFSWVTPLVTFGYKEKVKLEHLGVLPDNYNTSIQEDKLSRYWNKYKYKKKGYPLIWAI